MQFLGLVGKLLTGPWMQLFYISAQGDLSRVDGIAVVNGVLSTLRDTAANPRHILDRTADFFGRDLNEYDQTLKELMRTEPVDMDMFVEMISSCLIAVITVLERQYKRYFEMDITEELRKETLSAKVHNIDAEEIIGMFSAGKERAKNANVDFLIAKMRARNIKVVPWLDDMYQQKRKSIVTWAIGRARERRNVNRKKDSWMKREMSKRTANKRQQKTEKERRV